MAQGHDRSKRTHATISKPEARFRMSRYVSAPGPSSSTGHVQELQDFPCPISMTPSTNSSASRQAAGKIRMG
eukprot:6624345-Pyramimonas_sp.AAC.1